MISAESEDVVVAWTTFPAEGDPAPLVRALVETQVAACVTVQEGVRSVYRWQGAVEQASERQLTIKTTRGRLDALGRMLDELHPYEVPELLVAPVGGARAYLDWIRAETASEEA